MGKAVPNTVASRRNQCLGINLTKKVKNCYNVKYTKLKKDIEEDTRR
jgi:hypothetical protein